mgnify:CR=1 FL=1
MKEGHLKSVPAKLIAKILVENDQLKSVLSEILESTWVVKSPCYYKVLVEAKVINRAKELVDAKKN